MLNAVPLPVDEVVALEPVKVLETVPVGVKE